MPQTPTEDELRQAFAFLKGKTIPKMPEVISALRRALAEDDPDIGRVARIIAEDSGLSGLVLKSVNSAAYTRAEQIESVVQAGTLLGISTLNEIVIDNALRRSIGYSTELQNLVWIKARACAQGAKALAEGLAGISVEAAYNTALFHDVGALIIEFHDPNYIDRYNRFQDYPISESIEEYADYRTTHATIGYLLARHWQLSDPVCNAIYLSHIESCAAINDSSTRTLVAVLKLVNHYFYQVFAPDAGHSLEATSALADGFLELAIDSAFLQKMSAGIESRIW